MLSLTIHCLKCGATSSVVVKRADSLVRCPECGQVQSTSKSRTDSKKPSARTTKTTFVPASENTDENPKQKPLFQIETSLPPLLRYRKPRVVPLVIVAVIGVFCALVAFKIAVEQVNAELSLPAYLVVSVVKYISKSALIIISLAPIWCAYSRGHKNLASLTVASMLPAIWFYGWWVDIFIFVKTRLQHPHQENLSELLFAKIHDLNTPGSDLGLVPWIACLTWAFWKNTNITKSEL